MEKVLINGHNYTFIKAFRDNEALRKSYNSLTRKTYGFDFEQWYQDGYWGNTYIPHSLMDDEKIVANVSCSIIDYLILGKTKRFIQIGAVMTDPAYRNQGLARYLIEKVLDEYKDKCDMIYLFANDSVLDFYPKFGFTAVNEYQYSRKVTNDDETIAAEKLDMSLASSRDLLIERIKSSIPVSKLAMLRNVGLIMFYCTSFMSDKVYYIRELDVIVIAEFDEDTLYLQDIFSKVEVDLDCMVKLLSSKWIKKAVLGFTPKDEAGYDINLLREEDTTLFVMKDKTELFAKNTVRFPVLSHT